ncbi:MAG TPA: DinB family protein [Acidobacteriota bacterium]|nr:DinB family protein [Acidobacteriota bacterium]
MREIERILDLHKRAYEGNAWHGPSVLEALSGVGADKAAANPVADAHSIWQIVLHITAWERGVRLRLEGNEVTLTAERDWPPIKDVSSASWKETLDHLDHEHQFLHQAIAKLSDDSLEKRLPGSPYDAYVTLHGVIQHDLFHAGQIMLLKKG